jgi:hypothetical protein
MAYWALATVVCTLLGSHKNGTNEVSVSKTLSIKTVDPPSDVQRLNITGLDHVDDVKGKGRVKLASFFTLLNVTLEFVDEEAL